MKIQIKKLKENAIIPTRGSDRAAGYDLYACLVQMISPPVHFLKNIIPCFISNNKSISVADFKKSGMTE